MASIEHVPRVISVHGTKNWCVKDNFNTLQRSVPQIEAVELTVVVRYVQSLTRIISASSNFNVNTLSIKDHSLSRS